MPIVIGDQGQGGFSVPVQQRQQAGIINLSPERGGGGGGGLGGPSQADMMQYAAENQQQRAIEHANLQSWLGQQALTQHEQMEMQRNQNAAAYVNNDPNLTDAERQELLMQIYTRTSPLQARQRQEQLKHQQMVNEQVMHQNAQITSMQNMDEAGRAQAAQNMRIPDGMGGFIQLIPGQHPIHVQGQEDRRAQQAVQRQEREDKAREAHEQKWHAERRHAEEQARRELTVAGGDRPDDSAVADRADEIMRRHGMAPDIYGHMRPYDAGHPRSARPQAPQVAAAEEGGDEEGGDGEEEQAAQDAPQRDHLAQVREFLDAEETRQRQIAQLAQQQTPAAQAQVAARLERRHARARFGGLD